MKKSKYLQVLTASVASGLSIKDASVVAGCSESTGYTISCSDEFKTEVCRLRSEAVQQAVDVLTSNVTKASNALVKLLDSADEKVVLAAATKLMGMLPELQDLAELRARVDSIERQAQLRVAR